MEARLHDDVDEFRGLAESWYRRDPVLHTIELTALQSGVPADSVLLTVSNGSGIRGAAMQTPPYPLLVTGLSADAIDRAVGLLVSSRPGLTDVRGARATVLAFAAAWGAATGRRGRTALQERLYRLGTLRPPAGVPGKHRLSTVEDRNVLVDWVECFFVETFSSHRDEAAGRRFVANARAVGDRFVLWTVAGVPVSMALLRAPAAGVSRIGPVFTPVSGRGNGYGSAVTAAAADLARRSGTPEVVLFADLANPVSNAIYQRIGFEPVSDSVRFDLG